MRSDDDERRRLVEIEAAVLLGNVDAEQPELAGTAHERRGRAPSPSVSSRSSFGSTSLLDELLDRLRHQPVLVRQLLRREDVVEAPVSSSSQEAPLREVLTSLS